MNDCVKTSFDNPGLVLENPAQLVTAEVQALEARRSARLGTLALAVPCLPGTRSTRRRGCAARFPGAGSLRTGRRSTDPENL